MLALAGSSLFDEHLVFACWDNFPLLRFSSFQVFASMSMIRRSAGGILKASFFGRLIVLSNSA